MHEGHPGRDPAKRTARAEGSVLWRELDHETQAFGLATTGGMVSNIGIAGLTLGGGIVLYPLDRPRGVLRFYREFCATPPDAGEANCAHDLRARQSLLDEPNAVHGLHRYWCSTFADRISDELIDLLVEGAAQFTSPLSALLLFYMHSVCTRVAPNMTAFAARKAQWDFDAIGCWTDGATSTRHIACVRELSAKLAPHLSPSAYVNHISDDDKPEVVRASFGGNYARLRQLKSVYDPGNLFRINANIPPG